MEKNSFSWFGLLVKLFGILIAVMVIYWVGTKVHRYLYHEKGDWSSYQRDISPYLGYWFEDDGKYVYRLSDNRIILRGLDWLFVSNDDKQPLACFSKGGKRGFIDRNTGEVVVEPHYKHAWMPGDSLAAVVDMDNKVKFIDCLGNIVIDDTTFVYEKDNDYQFERQMCVMTDGKGNKGLIDRQGKWVIPPRYASIYATCKDGYWHLKDAEGYEYVADNLGKLVIGKVSNDVEVTTSTICITYEDHTIQLFDFDGKLMVDFAYEDIENIKYGEDEYGDEKPLGICRCLKYEAGDSYYGLMSPKGRRITSPLYSDIKGVGPDLYLCYLEYTGAVLLNGRGEEVK
ncbi:MAG: WG repeat-containing protein [Prevotella sp.]|nr:WG repeat-containing protein [Prevotella sp.]